MREEIGIGAREVGEVDGGVDGGGSGGRGTGRGSRMSILRWNIVIVVVGGGGSVAMGC
jgi:hypothetical protein